MKLVRVLVYEGDPEWLARTMARSLVPQDKPYSCDRGTITELVRSTEGELPKAPANQDPDDTKCPVCGVECAVVMCSNGNCLAYHYAADSSYGYCPGSGKEVTSCPK